MRGFLASVASLMRCLRSLRRRRRGMHSWNIAVERLEQKRLLSVVVGDNVVDAVIADTSFASTEIPAFPGAAGHGALTPGGRGGAVYQVTNLNDSGPGSLRAAVEASGPRTVVFRVAGVIALQSNLQITSPYLTIAGQTAPAPGVTLRFASSAYTSDDPERAKILMEISTHDVIVRYLKFRRGDSVLEGDNIEIKAPAERIIFDHVSLSWSTDESVSIWTYEETDAEQAQGIRDVSFQQSIIAESLRQDIGHWIDPAIEHTPEQLADPTYTDYRGSTVANSHPLGFIVGGKSGYTSWQAVQNIDIHHNLFANNTHRNPRVMARGVRVINNFIYNWFTRAGSSSYSTQVDYIGNVYRHGPMGLFADDSDIPTPRPHFLWHDTTSSTGEIVDPEPGSIYIAGNIAPEIPEMRDPGNDNWSMLMDSYTGNVRGESPQLDPALRRTDPLPESPVPIPVDRIDTSSMFDLLIDLGANGYLNASGQMVTHVDFVDARNLRAAVTNQTRYRTKSRIYRTAEQAGGYDSLNVQLTSAWADQDQDGMSDAWELQSGVDLVHFEDADGDGYTNLEEFLNQTSPFAPDTELINSEDSWSRIARLLIVQPWITDLPEAIDAWQQIDDGAEFLSVKSVLHPLDLDRDGVIVPGETDAIRMALLDAWPELSVWTTIVPEMDLSGDGQVDLQEARGGLLQVLSDVGTRRIRSDFDRDGQVTASDARVLLDALNQFPETRPLTGQAVQLLDRAESAGLADADFRTVLIADLLQESFAGQTGSPGAILYDFDGDGQVSADDIREFRQTGRVPVAQVQELRNVMQFMNPRRQGSMTGLRFLERALAARAALPVQDAALSILGFMWNVPAASQIASGLDDLDPDGDGVVAADELNAARNRSAALIPRSLLRKLGVKLGLLPAS